MTAVRTPCSRHAAGDCMMHAGVEYMEDEAEDMEDEADDMEKLIIRAAEIIRRGGLVAFPTETVYGLGADALNARAVARIFEVKRRPRFDPLIVHISDFSMVYELCDHVDERAEKLMRAFWPGPLTIVLPKSEIVPDIVTASLPTVAVRMPAHPIALRLIEKARTPIAAPSANPFGYLSPTSADDVREMLGDRIDMIIDGGRCPIGVESTVIYIAGDKKIVLRPGGLPVEEIERVIGAVEIESHEKKQKPRSPGQLPKHYAPRTPLVIASADEIRTGTVKREMRHKRCGLLAFKKPTPECYHNYDAIEVLSDKGDLVEAAANLFACLRRLDRRNLDIIYAEPVPEVGLGRAVMDRLRKAAWKASSQ